jgi:hypothetical protein
LAEKENGVNRIVIVCALVCLALSIAPQNKSMPVKLAWQFPACDIEPGLSFFIYTATKHPEQTSSWSRITNMGMAKFGSPKLVAPGNTNQLLIGTVLVSPGLHYFAVTTSNYNGESVFSNIATNPPIEPKSKPSDQSL